MNPPRVLLVMPAQWPRALLRAALREVGYDAVGTRGLKAADFHAGAKVGRGPVRLIMLDQDALTDEDRRDLDVLREASGAPVVLLAHATHAVPKGPWTRVLRRPLSVAELVRAVEESIPLPPEARGPVE